MVACNVTVYAPALVPVGTVTLAVIFTGALAVGFTVAAGVRLHVAFAIPVLQEIVTLCAKEPAAVAWKLTEGEVVPSPVVTLAGEGVVNPKATRCSVTGTVCVI